MDEALAAIQAHVDVPVVLPDFPRPLHLDRADPVSMGSRTFAGRVYRGGTLQVHAGGPGHHRFISIQYGLAMFDGCGEDTAKAITIRGVPALLLHYPGATDLIWPATPSQFWGQYGLSTSYRAERTVRMAASMIENARSFEGDC